MKKVEIAASKTYEVLIGNGLLRDLGVFAAAVVTPAKLLLVTDSNVAPLYLPQVRESLTAVGFEVTEIIIPAGEANKTLETYAQILQTAAGAGLTRSDVMLALGGGVVGDMTGFAAATYMRGIRFISVPTTFLAAVDASVGGKTAVDLPQGKNLAGAFHQPELVVCDCASFSTLPPARFADGIAESVKHALIADEGFFEKLKSAHFSSDIIEIVARNIEIKRDFVLADEFDKGARQLLNFGHTIGHAIEKCSDYSISHGEAVAIGMVAEQRAAEKLGFTSEISSAEIARVLQRHNLPTACEYSSREIIRAARSDKKFAEQSLTVGYLDKIGAGALKRISVDSLENYVNLALGEE